MSVEAVKILGIDLDGTLIWPTSTNLINLSFSSNEDRKILQGLIEKFSQRKISFWNFEKDEDKSSQLSQEEERDLQDIIKTLMSNKFWDDNPTLGDLKVRYHIQARFGIDALLLKGPYKFFIASRNPSRLIVNTIVDVLFPNKGNIIDVINFFTHKREGKVPHISRICEKLANFFLAKVVFCDDEQSILTQLETKFSIRGLFFPQPNLSGTFDLEQKLQQSFASAPIIHTKQGIKRELSETLTAPSGIKKKQKRTDAPEASDPTKKENTPEKQQTIPPFPSPPAARRGGEPSEGFSF